MDTWRDWPANQIPYIEEARHGAEEFLLTAGGQRNRNHAGDQVEFRIQDFAMEEILFDPQTSGGLLAAVRPEQATEILQRVQALGLPCGIIGRIEESTSDRTNHRTKVIVEQNL